MELFPAAECGYSLEVGGEDDHLATASDIVGVYKTRGYNTPALLLQGRLDATVNGASQRANFNT